MLLITYAGWTLMSYTAKLEGTYLPLFMISLFMLTGAPYGIVQPLFKHIKIYNIYRRKNVITQKRDLQIPLRHSVQFYSGYGVLLPVWFSYHIWLYGNSYPFAAQRCR